MNYESNKTAKSSAKDQSGRGVFLGLLRIGFPKVVAMIYTGGTIAHVLRLIFQPDLTDMPANEGQLASETTLTGVSLGFFPCWPSQHAEADTRATWLSCSSRAWVAAEPSWFRGAPRFSSTRKCACNEPEVSAPQIPVLSTVKWDYEQHKPDDRTDFWLSFTNKT